MNDYEYNPPFDIREILGGETADFMVKANRTIPARKAIYPMGLGLFWLLFTSIFFFAFLGPLFVGKEVHFTSNGQAVVASPSNLGPITVPALIIVVFLIVGLAITGYGIYILFSKGAWFIGTEKRFIMIKKNEIRSIDWEQFTGDIEVKGKPEKASLTLVMRTGRMVSRRRGGDEYIPDTIYMAEIKDAFKIEPLLRKRIKENDPTPANPEYTAT